MNLYGPLGRELGAMNECDWRLEGTALVRGDHTEKTRIVRGKATQIVFLLVFQRRRRRCVCCLSACSEHLRPETCVLQNPDSS